MSLKSKAYKLTALSLLLAPMALSTFQGVTVMAEDPVIENPEPESTEIPVTLHKLIFDKDNPRPVEDVQNTGDIMTADDFGVTSMTKLPGVTFAAYDITSLYYQMRSQKTGGALVYATAQDVVAAIEAMSLTVLDDGKLMNGETQLAEEPTETRVTGTDKEAENYGEANFVNLAKKSGGKDAVYIFMETDAPDGITQKANPMVLVLPAYKYDAEGNITDIPLDEINLYPKNSSKLGSLTADKYLQYYDGAEEDKLNEHLINGVQFVIHKAGTDINNYAEGDAIFLGPIDSDTSLRSWVTRDKADIFTTKKVGDKDGQLTADNLAVNDYLLSEISSSVGVGDKENKFGKNSTVINREFSITQNSDGTIVNAALTGTSEGLINDDIIIEKDNTGGDFQYGDVESYVASTVIPKGMADQITKLDAEDKPVLSPLYTNYSFTDTHSEWLVLEELKVLVDGEELEIGNNPEEPNYVLSKTADSFTINFPTPLETLGEYSGKEISVEYTMSLKPGAPADENFNNEIINESDFDSDTDEGKDVFTGGRKFIKVDGHSGAKLAGAKFNISDALKNGNLLYVDATGNYKFSASKPENYTLVELTSDEEGKFEIKGLKYGTYYLQEIAVPDSSYILPDGRFEFVIDKGSYDLSHGSLKTEKVENFSKGTLPSTGGMGTIVFFLVGAVAMTGVVAVSRKKKA